MFLFTPIGLSRSWCVDGASLTDVGFIDADVQRQSVLLGVFPNGTDAIYGVLLDIRNNNSNQIAQYDSQYPGQLRVNFSCSLVTVLCHMPSALAIQDECYYY